MFVKLLSERVDWVFGEAELVRPCGFIFKLINSFGGLLFNVEVTLVGLLEFPYSKVCVNLKLPSFCKALIQSLSLSLFSLPLLSECAWA